MTTQSWAVSLTRLQQTSLWVRYLWALEFLSQVADSDLMICLCLSVTLIPWFPGGWSLFQDCRSSVHWPPCDPLDLLCLACDKASPWQAHLDPWAQIFLAFSPSVAAAASLFLPNSSRRILGLDHEWWLSLEWCRWWTRDGYPGAGWGAWQRAGRGRQLRWWPHWRAWPQPAGPRVLQWPQGQTLSRCWDGDCQWRTRRWRTGQSPSRDTSTSWSSVGDRYQELFRAVDSNWVACECWSLCYLVSESKVGMRFLKACGKCFIATLYVCM